MKRAGLAVVLAVTIGRVVVAQAQAQEFEVETFTLPRTIQPAMPRYPTGAADGDEAWVELNFMVDTEGRAFEPVVARSFGREVFEAAALEALGRMRFDPARLDGEAIVGSSSHRFDFMVQAGAPYSGAVKRFSGQYRNFQRALRTKERERIEIELARLEEAGARNHYEHAYLSLARYSYAVRFGTEEEQLLYLRGALSESSDPEDSVFIDADLVPELRRALLPLELRHNRFPEAFDTYVLMAAEGDDEAVAFFAETMENARAIEFDDTEFVIPLEIDDSGSAWVRLFKHHVAFIDGKGALREVKLRCEQKYLAFEVERDVSYEVPAEWGECSLELVGDAGAEAFLLQH